MMQGSVKNFLKHFKGLLFFMLVLNAIWLFICLLASPPAGYLDTPLLSGFFFGATSLCLFIFFRGQTRKPKEEFFHSLTAISLKFLLELFTALFWFLILKKTDIFYIILFFVLYLAFSMITVVVILKSLKNKTLKD